jgi:hypothetical protein
MRIRARSLGLSGVRDGLGQHLIQIRRNRTRLDDTEAIVVEHRDLAERVPGQVVGLTRLSRQHVHRNLFIVRVFFAKQHPHGADIGAAVEAVEDNARHFTPRLLPDIPPKNGAVSRSSQPPPGALFPRPSYAGMVISHCTDDRRDTGGCRRSG